MTALEWQAGLIERAAKILAFAISTTKEDRLEWCPAAEAESKTRCALEQARECIGVNRRMAAILRGETPPPAGENQALPGSAEAQEQLVASAKELADVVRGLDEAALARTYTTARGDLPGATLIVLPAFNMMYHVGQVNYIQLLYGDTEFRFPPN